MADLDRCDGATLDAVCSRRETCLRYRVAQAPREFIPWYPTPEAYVWYVHPQIPGPCALHVPVPTPEASRG